jgi:hypothetical protein
VSFLRLDMRGVEAMLLDLTEVTEEAARPAAQAASQVLYEEVKRNVAVIPRKTGNLDSAIYQVFSQDNSSPGRATYHISWNHSKAPHGYLVEMGHIQRYVTYIGKDGQFYTAKRPEARGKPRPSGRASQAAKDAYWMPLTTPKQVPGHAFVRRAAVKFPQAAAAAADVIARAIE